MNARYRRDPMSIGSRLNSWLISVAFGELRFMIESRRDSGAVVSVRSADAPIVSSTKSSPAAISKSPSSFDIREKI